ncbi:MAG: 23S rRNA pseudouridine(955/2504/2580) synthase, partial [Gammaproteobacteria bacterium]
MSRESQQYQAVRQVTIDEGHAGQRIDNFLCWCLKGVPKARIYRLLRKGEVRVNSRRVRQDYRLQMGDRVRVPPVRYAEPRESGAPDPRSRERISQSILHEDDALLVLDKPSGIAVHGGSGRSFGIIEALRTMRPRAPFLELVHRLDKDTSGCLLVAKKRSALRTLHEAFRAHRVEKAYLALVAGRLTGGKRTVSEPLRRNTLRAGERIVTVDPDGKASKTVFKVKAATAAASLAEVVIHTGRTHQIRVHAASTGHPLAGDLKYGDREFNKLARKSGLRRLFL